MMTSQEYKPFGFHSVSLDEDKCQGCTVCIRHCPTEAIRVRGGKAKIISDRCIDCGNCIRVCPHHAKRAIIHKLEDFEGKFKWTVAIPAPSLYGQFPGVEDIDYVLTALKRIGFNDVFEVSRAAEIVSDYSRKIIAGGKVPKPVISTACPAVVRLVNVRFPDLSNHLMPVRPPIEVAANIARRRAVRQTGLREDEIGIFFISPCPAKMTACLAPIAGNYGKVDGILSMSDLYIRIGSEIKKIDEPERLSHSGIIGIGWAASGGEATALLKDIYVAADGIDNCIQVLEEVENYRLNDVDFIELNACTGGCVGGVLTVENPFVAKARIHMLRKYLPVSMNKFKEDGADLDIIYADNALASPARGLSSDREEALRMVKQINDLVEKFPGIDCGACGAPSCKTFAEDVVRGYGRESDCTFVLRKQIAGMFSQLELPPNILAGETGKKVGE
ncbi:MAG TPA: [Fe-Fe] hydrogenase large subunit C-terminal domain-containing protein [Candidatus Acidoferrum sp.]|nr:[Fe-Fe] hydrogenase large subunit C-terminal domain-containing protein [Candidatus Acidoferrum sp.]